MTEAPTITEQELLWEVACAATATEWPDPRMSYVEIQIGRQEWQGLREWLKTQQEASDRAYKGTDR